MTAVGSMPRKFSPLPVPGAVEDGARPIRERHIPPDPRTGIFHCRPGHRLSGRGVGMDVVRKHVEKLRGRIEIRSEAGRGATFLLKLPLTLAIIDGLVVTVGPHRYIVPLFAVREMFRPAPESIFTVQNRQEMVLVRGRLLPDGITVGADGVATRLYAVVPGRRGPRRRVDVGGVARLCLCSPSSGRARWAPTMCGRPGRSANGVMWLSWISTANGHARGHSEWFRRTMSVEEGLAKADAAVVAVPSELHEDVMRQIIERGLPVLLEKPVAVEFAAAERIRRSAAEQGVQVLVGHIERFNSAVEELMRHADSAVHIECRREGAGAGRPVGDVVSDLMVHDLDIVRALARSREGSDATINTRAAMWGNGGTEHCTALLQTDAGMTVTLVASRIGQFKRREIVLTQPGCEVIADLVRQSVTIHRLQRTEFVGNGRGSFRQQGTTEIPYLDSGEPLVREHRHLVDIVTNREQPLVSLDDGVAAIRLVEQVRRAAGRARPAAAAVDRCRPRRSARWQTSGRPPATWPLASVRWPRSSASPTRRFGLVVCRLPRRCRSTAVQTCSSTHHSTRPLGCRSWRRWPAAARWLPQTSPRCPKPQAAQRCSRPGRYRVNRGRFGEGLRPKNEPPVWSGPGSSLGQPARRARSRFTGRSMHSTGERSRIDENFSDRRSGRHRLTYHGPFGWQSGLPARPDRGSAGGEDARRRAWSGRPAAQGVPDHLCP